MLLGECHTNDQVPKYCPFLVYIHQAVAERFDAKGEGCEGFDLRSGLLVRPGETYHSPHSTYRDGCGTSLKVFHKFGDTPVYQVKYSINRRNSKVWYNLSAEDGAPFQDVNCKLCVSFEGCKAGHCASGQYNVDKVHGCGWAIQPVWAQIGRVMATLCEIGKGQSILSPSRRRGGDGNRPEDR